MIKLKNYRQYKDKVLNFVHNQTFKDILKEIFDYLYPNIFDDKSILKKSGLFINEGETLEINNVFIQFLGNKTEYKINDKSYVKKGIYVSKGNLIEIKYIDEIMISKNLIIKKNIVESYKQEKRQGFDVKYYKQIEKEEQEITESEYNEYLSHIILQDSLIKKLEKVKNSPKKINK